MSKSLEEIYKIIDDPNYVIIDHNVNKLFKEFYDETKLNNDIELLKQAQLEIDLQNFKLMIMYLVLCTQEQTVPANISNILV